MEKGAKVLVVVGSILTGGLIAYLVYRHNKSKKDAMALVPVNATDSSSKDVSANKGISNDSKTPKSNESLSLKITNVDWVKKIVSFQVFLGHKVYMSQNVAWDKSQFGGEFGYVGSPLFTSSNQIEIVGSNLPMGLVLVVKSNGVNKSGRIIDFNSKTVKVYNGANMVKDIASAKEALKKVMGFSFFDGEELSYADNTPPPSDFSKTQKWVYTIESGKDFCRWYDGNGKNTRTYNSPCSKSQANMYNGNSKKTA